MKENREIREGEKRLREMGNLSMKYVREAEQPPKAQGRGKGVGRVRMLQALTAAAAVLLVTLFGVSTVRHRQAAVEPPVTIETGRGEEAEKALAENIEAMQEPTTGIAEESGMVMAAATQMQEEPTETTAEEETTEAPQTTPAETQDEAGDEQQAENSRGWIAFRDGGVTVIQSRDGTVRYLEGMDVERDESQPLLRSAVYQAKTVADGEAIVLYRMSDNSPGLYVPSEDRWVVEPGVFDGIYLQGGRLWLGYHGQDTKTQIDGLYDLDGHLLSDSKSWVNTNGYLSDGSMLCDRNGNVVFTKPIDDGYSICNVFDNGNILIAKSPALYSGIGDIQLYSRDGQLLKTLDEWQLDTIWATVEPIAFVALRSEADGRFALFDHNLEMVMDEQMFREKLNMAEGEELTYEGQLLQNWEPSHSCAYGNLLSFGMSTEDENIVTAFIRQDGTFLGMTDGSDIFSVTQSRPWYFHDRMGYKVVQMDGQTVSIHTIGEEEGITIDRDVRWRYCSHLYGTGELLTIDFRESANSDFFGVFLIHGEEVSRTEYADYDLYSEHNDIYMLLRQEKDAVAEVIGAYDAEGNPVTVTSGQLQFADSCWIILQTGNGLQASYIGLEN